MNLEEYERSLRRALVRGLNMAAIELRKRVIDQVPMSNVGTLAGSAQVVPATESDLEAGVSLDTPYAVRLHEHPEYNFRHDINPNAKGKYLEDPLMNGADDYYGIIAAQIRAVH